jgi:hypothetical protein
MYVYIYVYVYIYIYNSVIRSRRMIQTGHVARMGERRSTDRLDCCWGTLNNRGHLENVGVGAKTTIQGMLQKLDGVVDCIAMSQNKEQVVGYSEYGIALPGSINAG